MSKGKIRNRNAPQTVTRQHESVAQERAAIDATFAEMAKDVTYQAEAQLICAEFVEADWESWRLFEDRYRSQTCGQ